MNRCANGNPAPTGRPGPRWSVQAWSLVGLGYLAAFGAATVAAVYTLAGRADRLPGWFVDVYDGLVYSGVLVAAVAFLVGRRRLGLSRSELGLPPRKEAFSAGSLVAVAAAYLVMRTAFAVLALFPQPESAKASEVLNTGMSTGRILLWSATAGVVEEALLLALPVAVMTRMRWPWPAQLAVLVALRLPFHLYYGVQFLAQAVIWAGGLLFVYRRYRVLWPFALAHSLYDTISQSLYGRANPLLGAALLVLGGFSMVCVARGRFGRTT